MTVDDVVERLETGNQHLDLIAKTYFISLANLDHPIVGHYSFKDIYHNFTYSLREYSITHSRKIEPSESPSIRKLLKLNNITILELRHFIANVNGVLQSYTDKSWGKEKRRRVLEQQIRNFTGYYADDEEETEYKMLQKLSTDNDWGESKNRYLNSVLSAMKDAEVNQVENDKYIVISSLFGLFDDMSKYLGTSAFLEKKKYLTRLSHDKKIATLKKYVEKMRHDNLYYEPNSDEALQYIRWFLFYLIYNKHKADIFMIHSVLGYKYDGILKLYQKLFCKDYSTGKNDNFLHHTDILNLQYHRLDSENDIFFDTVAHYL